MPEKLPITVTMTARNAEATLRLSLGSVAGWVSEIVVVINDCSDATAEIARSHGAQVYELPFENLRDQKGKAIALAAQPWILHLDADEAVSPELREEISRFFSGDIRVDGVWLPRRLQFLGRWMLHGDAYPDRVLRLFRNGKGRVAGVPEHDRFEVDGKTGRFRKDLLHYSNDSLSRQISKINFFSDAFLERQRARHKRFSAVEAVFRAAWRFFRAYLFRGGILDGFPGLYLASFSAFSTFVRYARLYEAELKDDGS
ncbi:MAG: glycosyltransferase family 2 protein [Verrucomicrobium sp.]|nr:glycosyltransferase family 2 protein [Verrucomicrobium sp.]